MLCRGDGETSGTELGPASKSRDSLPPFKRFSGTFGFPDAHVGLLCFAAPIDYGVIGYGDTIIYILGTVMQEMVEKSQPARVQRSLDACRLLYA